MVECRLKMVKANNLGLQVFWVLFCYCRSGRRVELSKEV